MANAIKPWSPIPDKDHPTPNQYLLQRNGITIEYGWLGGAPG
jgi:hypothetical protein